MARGFMLKMRPRMAGAKRRRQQEKHVKGDIRRLENLEERLEHVTDDIHKEIEDLEEVKHGVAARKKEFSWITGQVSELTLQDFVGAVFGAMFFALTQEVWQVALTLSLSNTFLVFLLSFGIGFLLVYLSRRRKFLSEKVFHNVLLRSVEIYTMSLFASLIFVWIFSLAPNSIVAFKEMIMISLPAVISAATADLLFY